MQAVIRQGSRPRIGISASRERGESTVGIVIRKRMKAGTETIRVADMRSPRSAGSNSEGPDARYRTQAEESAEKCRREHLSLTRPECFSADMENQDWYSTHGEYSSVIEADFFGML